MFQIIGVIRFCSEFELGIRGPQIILEFLMSNKLRCYLQHYLKSYLENNTVLKGTSETIKMIY